MKLANLVRHGQDHVNVLPVVEEVVVIVMNAVVKIAVFRQDLMEKSLHQER
jgi:hypothetical protein